MILGIDYGRQKIGLAIADLDSKLAEPLKVLPNESKEKTALRLKKIAEENSVSKIIIGVSEGEMAQETKKFGEGLGRELGLDVFYQDETLSTQEAQKSAIDAGIGRSRRKKMEDAFAAAIMLQSYLDFGK